MSSKERTGPPPVEPMTNAAWSRVERGLFDRLDQPAPRPMPVARPRWPWLAIPAFAAVAAAIVIIVLATRGAPTTTEVALPTPPVPSPIVPSRVVAGDTPSMVSYGDAHLTVQAHAAIVMGREDSSPSVLVERGAVDFTVAPRERETFVVRAGDVVVRVVGTQFRVARFDERVTVTVERGRVDVQFRGEVHQLSSGQSWSSPEQTANIAPTPVVDEPVPPIAPPKGSNGKPAAGSDEKPGADEERAKFDLMASLEHEDPEQAMKGYLELSKGNSKWSAVALFSAGRLAFDRKDPKARTYLTIFLKRFPRDPNAQDARGLLSRLDGANR